MKRNFKILFAFSLVFVSLNTSAQLKHDVFPFSKYLQYSYSFYQQLEMRDLGYPAKLETDSGKVEYIIRDSVKYGDTLIVWNVEQRQNLLHKKYSGLGTLYSLDTMYSVIDTNDFSLSEYLAGNHKLQCSSVVWLFPLKVWPNSVGITSPDSNVYRYSDSVNVLFTLSNPDPVTGWQDSICFSVENGLYRRVTNSYSLHNEWWFYALDVKQIGNPTEVEQENVDRISRFTLFQNYPNPFNPSTTIKYSLARSANITLELYDCLGRKLRDIENGFRSPGEHIVTLNLSHLPSGVYFYKLNAGYYSVTRKLIILK